ncbi:4-aminobutyrate--2-oxoglutarate transaminase [Limnohabitans sp. DCL3]|uniref:4-aminobutyrate--2-oxoglutarate transaminase n=1 Tax=Limnohabitans sp. DCL3 TaxID=3374103 RepID=UPI003A89AD7A
MNNQNSNAVLMVRKNAATPRGIGVMASFFADRADNAELWDVQGQRYLDFAGGIAVLNTGHRHPKVVAAVQAQLERFTHTCYQVVPYESYVALAEKLNVLTPGTHAKKTAFFSTGAEAVENAIKIARAATGRSGVIAFGGAFHGRSLYAVGLTGKVAPYKTAFGPMASEVYHVPYPSDEASLAQAREAVTRLFKYDIEPGRVAAFIFEPVQGEGGFHVMHDEAVCWVRELCTEHGMVMIADEVQSGFGRTGQLFCMAHHEQRGITADLLISAKSMAAGLNLSAVTGRAALMDAPAPGGLGGTYAGNPLAIAAAHAVIEIMLEEKLPARGQRLGDQLKARLHGLQMRLPQLTIVRGLGAMVAAEFRRADGSPDSTFTKAVQAHALAHGLILLSCGMDANVLRFLFPLTIAQTHFEEALDILEAALTAAHTAGA